jgi:indole-3-glycerol phosphate synthase
MSGGDGPPRPGLRIGVRSRRWGVIDRILGPKRAEVARMLAAPPLLPRRRPGGGVVEALARPRGEALRLLAEVKFRSPSAGELSRVLGAGQRALAYARGGARMISVLTDRPFFGGSFDDLAAARDSLDAALGDARPRLLCKEFVLDAIQLDRAADAGADAVLLIARIVSPERLAALAAAARRAGLEPLVEVATLEELDAAHRAEARVVGVNARDLNTLKMDAARAAEVLRAVPPEAVAVHLSGLAAPADVARVAGGRADAALIGEALMRQDDPEELLRAMVHAARG